MFLMLLAVVALFSSSCTKVPKSAKLIPEDATFVARLNVKQIAEKAGMNGNSPIKNDLKSALKDAGLSRQLTEKFNAILEDPSEAGLDLRDPLFIYGKMDLNHVGEPEAGLVGTVYDADKFEALLNDIQKDAGLQSLKRADDLRYVTFDNILLAFNDDIFCIKSVPQDKNEKTVLNDLKTALNADGEKTMYENKFFKQMCSKSGDAQFLISYGILSHQPYINYTETLSKKGLNYEDYAYLFDVNIKQGETVIDCENLVKSEAWEEFLNQYEGMSQTINGDFAKHISKDGLAFFGNINGSKLFEVIKDMLASEKVSENELAMAEPIFNSIDGDIALGFSGIDVKTAVPDVKFYAKTKDATIVNFIVGMGQFGDDLKKKGKNNYEVMMPESTKSVFSFGWKDNTTYFATKGSQLAFANAANPFDKGDVGKYLYYGYFNFNMLNRIDAESLFGLSVSKELEMIAKIFDYVEMYAKDMRKGTVRIVQRNKDENIIQAIYAYAKGFVSRQQAEWAAADSIYADAIEYELDSAMTEAAR